MSVTAALGHPDVEAAIDQAADAGVARRFLERVVEADPGVADGLVANPVVRDALVAVACASRSLSNAIVSDPSLVDVLDDLDRALGTPPPDPQGLRRWKRRELLRIASADLLGQIALPEVGRRLSALADACLAAAVALSEPAVPFAVVAMGKLGGRELNYASDVDVLFVHDGAGDLADAAARRLLAIMGEPSADGIVFRTDADLRPEGHAGALSRTLDSYAAWYERWARPWEFQALLKARPAAGDLELAAQLVSATRPLVWPDVLDPDLVREARAMKARSEAGTRRHGVGTRELKRGPGGIRDIEFAVQLLQLVHGRQDPEIRSPTTLDALAQLADGGYVEADDAQRLSSAYIFLRTVEHRLQLRDEAQTHTLPADADSRTLLARVLGYRGRAEASALEAFDADHRAHQAQVRSIHEHLFFAPILDTLAGTGQLPVAVVEDRLVAFGFADTAQTRAALADLTRGLTRTSRVLQQLLPVILDWLSTAPDPDLGLLQLRRLIEHPARSSAVAMTFRDQLGAAARVCRVLGSSRLVGDALIRQPDVVDLLGDDDWFTRERTAEELRGAALGTLAWRDDPDARRAGLRRFKRRELLRIAARDVLDLAPLETTGRELAAVADACVEAALRSLDPPLPFAVIGMGSLGGRDLSYPSDLDLLFVYEGDQPSDIEAAGRVARELLAELGDTTDEGQTFRVDANLRPEGKDGPLARSLDSYRVYYSQWALVWEFQALLRARPVAGDPDLARRFMELVEPLVYRESFGSDEVREIRRMKARIERERIPPGVDPQFHLKLGRGGLSDVEFTVQLLQLQHGFANPAVRGAATLPALRALGRAGLLDGDDETVLAAAYGFCARARNACYLVTGRPHDALPRDADAARVGRLLGELHRPEATLRDDFRRVTRRSRRVVDRVFYGRAETPAAT